MDTLTWTILASVVSIIVYYLFVKKRHDFRDWGVPQPSGELPVLGSAPRDLYKFLVKKKHFVELLKELYDLDKDAKYVGAHSYLVPIVMVRDLDVIKAIMVKDFDHFVDRQSDISDESLDPVLLNNLASLNGDKWREVRNLLSPAFTSSKIKAMFELMDKCANNFISSFVEQCKSEAESDTKDAFTKYTNDVIATCAFGIEIDSMKDPTNKFYVYGRELMQGGVVNSLVGFAKFLFVKAFPKLSKKLQIKLLAPKITNFFVNVIGDVIKTRDEKGISRPDMLQLMMDARGKTSDKIKLGLEEMTAQAFVFFFGGFETTSAHMCLIAHMLAINPEVQAKLHDEIDAVVKETDGKITYEAINHMPYLDAVFQETLRLHPQGVILQRSCTKAYELPPTLPGAKPYPLKPGDRIIIPVAAIQRDPAYYDDPEKFDPERFLGTNIVTTRDAANLGFGMGPRMCIGNRFAILKTKLLFFHLLRRCSLEATSKTSNPLKYSIKNLTPVAVDGFWVKVSERKSA